MVKWTYLHQSKDVTFDLANMYFPMQWAREYCTVKFCLPRGSGHSHFAVQLCEEFMEPAIVVLNKDMKKNILIIAYPKVPKIFTMRELKVEGISISHKDGIIIDNASLFSKADITCIYNIFGRYMNRRQFVFLQ